jgi:HEAT repeat protein
MLKSVPGTKALLLAWLTLLDAPDVAVRRLGIEKVAAFDQPDVAAALLKQLDHADRGLRDNAIARLGRLDSGRKAMVQALLEADSADRAWILARAQEPFVATYDAAVRKRLLDRAFTYLEQNDRRADALLSVLRAANFNTLRDALEARALALRKKKKYEPALLFLRLLARDPACGATIRTEQAACALKLSAHDLSTEARAADPSLNQFAALVHGGNLKELTAYLRKAKWLETTELFYLGFHFAEKERQEKEFGGEVLRLVMERAKKTKLGKDAKSKLRNEGMD